MSSNSELETISKIIGSYGDRSMSKEIIQDEELNNLTGQIDYIIERRIELQEAVKLEELITAYTARATQIAYLTGFRDCMNFKQEVNSIYENQ